MSRSIYNAILICSYFYASSFISDSEEIIDEQNAAHL